MTTLNEMNCTKVFYAFPMSTANLHSSPDRRSGTGINVYLIILKLVTNVHARNLLVLTFITSNGQNSPYVEYLLSST